MPISHRLHASVHTAAHREQAAAAAWRLTFGPRHSIVLLRINAPASAWAYFTAMRAHMCGLLAR